MSNMISEIKCSNTREFAVACFDMSYADELSVMLSGDADSNDMNEWGIDANQWREAVLAAREDRIAFEEEGE